MALEARILAQAIGYPGEGDIIGAPPVFYFEPHQPEMSGFRPEVLLDITDVWETKRKAMECLAAQQHLWDYYTDLAVRSGVQLKRNARPEPGPGAHHHGRGVHAAVPADREGSGMRGVIVINPLKAEAKDVEALAGFGVATVSEDMGRTGLLGPQIRPIQQGVRVAGTAVTVPS
jgi:hypothetical protein